MRAPPAKSSAPAAAQKADQLVSSVLDFRKFVSSSGMTVAVRAGGAACSFLMSLVVVRALGATEAGLFFLGQTCLLLLAMVSRCGLDNVLVRYVSTATDQQRRGATTGVLVKAVTVAVPNAVIVSAVTYASADWIAGTILSQPEFADVLRVCAVGILPFSLFQLISYALQGNRRFVWSMGINAALFPMALLAAITFADVIGVQTAVGLTRAAVVIATGNALLATVVWYRASDRYLDTTFVSWSAISTTMLPLLCVALINYGNTWSPQLILAAYAEPADVAMLNVSQRMAALLALFLLPISSVASPTFAAMYARNDLAGLRQFAHRVNGVIILTSVPLLALIFVLAPQILSLFGSQFIDATWVLRVFVIGQLFTAISGSASFLLMVSGNEKLFRNAAGMSLLLGLVFAFVLVPRYGTLGAAVAGTGSLVVWNVLIWILVRRRLGVHVLKPDLRVVTRLMRGAA